MIDLAQAARSFGVCLTPEQVTAFHRYRDELLRWNRRFNLTAVEKPEAVEIRHFLDSLSLVIALRQLPDPIGLAWSTAETPEVSASAIDVGTGAGFPGLPLKLVWPELRLTLLEAVLKKVTFLRHVVELLGLSNVEAVPARAEELGHDPCYRESYDLVLARAVAPFPVLLEYTLPFCRVGGWFLAQKGPGVYQEMRHIQRALVLLGGAVREVLPVDVPFLDEKRTIVVIEKITPTAVAYPRRPGIPAKRPLI
ncbi:MAG TPA: 16S rRNA (guanine(527)-N(7))-methyltransferase RsmG [Anaerolineae bacterium]|nr:16S rRNA (guanine(527)-N(7))-methyltransferase RsmG [Anaerolineae bacterium]